MQSIRIGLIIGMLSSAGTYAMDIPSYIPKKSITPNALITARKAAIRDLIGHLSDKLAIAYSAQRDHEDGVRRIRTQSIGDVYRQADNLIAAVILPIFYATQIPRLMTLLPSKHISAISTLEAKLKQATEELNALSIDKLEIPIRQIEVIRQTGDACGFHATTNAKAIELLVGENAPEINADLVTAYAEFFNVRACPDNSLRNDNEVLDYAVRNTRAFSGHEGGLDLHNVYMLGKVDGTDHHFAITGSREDGKIQDECHEMTLISAAYEFDPNAVPEDTRPDIFNLQRPIDTLKNLVNRNGRGVVHFILGTPGHYVHASVIQYAEHTPAIFYTDSLNADLTEPHREAAREMVQFIKKEFETYLRNYE